MLAFNLKLSSSQRQKLEKQLKGNLQEVTRILALFSLADGKASRIIADILQLSVEAVRQ